MQNWHCCWTEEDQQIWYTRRMPANSIFMRYQHHVKEAELMARLTQIDARPGQGKLMLEALTRNDG